MSKDGKVKSIHFNKLIAIEAELLEHAERQKNFSEYVKSLILQDLRGVSRNVQRVAGDIDDDSKMIMIDLGEDDEMDSSEDNIETSSETVEDIMSGFF